MRLPFETSKKPDAAVERHEKEDHNSKGLLSGELAYWSKEIDEVALWFRTAIDKGLANQEAQNRLKEYGKNILATKSLPSSVHLLLYQFKSPIVIIFIATAILSYFLASAHDATIILVIVFLSAGLGFWQERGATKAVEQLLSLVKTRVTVLRDGKEWEIPTETTVLGDVVCLSAGDRIPADCLIVESKDLFVNESFLTGESYPIEKAAQGRALPEDTPLHKRSNSLFMGSYVASGRAKAIVVRTGSGTELGKISSAVKSRRAETDFERGVRRFGSFLIEVTLILVIANFAINVFLHRAILDSFLFSLALAIGLTPQLLPAIISVNLAHGAKRMAAKKVIIRKLDSIENFGSMNILCSDKTGTLTTGVIELHSAINVAGLNDDRVLLYAYLNAINETGFVNPIDQAVIRAGRVRGRVIEDSASIYEKLDEIPYDFTRKRLSILVRERHGSSRLKNDRNSSSPFVSTTPAPPASNVGTFKRDLLVTKGAISNILAACSKVEIPPGSVLDLDSSHRESIERIFEQMSQKGFRVLGVSYRYFDSPLDTVTPISANSTIRRITKADEDDSIFLGFLVLWDPVKDDAPHSIANLKKLGISLKMISGDNRLIAGYVGEKVGLSGSRLLTGPELDKMGPEALEKQVSDIGVFAEIEPQQKERIILALRKSGNVVGYMGDGVNDAPALHASDIGISVSTATDVVKQEADIVLLEKNLKVLAEGVKEGRRTFANTLKYVFMATSSNFGNMFSTAAASFFLPFIPMLPKQILLNNLLTDLQETTIASDRVDKEVLLRPGRWDMAFIRRFMIIFGPLSALFDFAMFGVLIFLLHATDDQFRTAWFIESVVSASLVVLVIRSSKPLFRSRPSKYLLIGTCLVAAAAFSLASFTTPIGIIFGLVSLPIPFYAWIGATVAMYIITAELTKRLFYKSTRIISR
jgi:Mg2+-importing ATPase